MTQPLGIASVAAMGLLKDKLDKIIVHELPFTYKEYIDISSAINKQVLDPDIKPSFLSEDVKNADSIAQTYRGRRMHNWFIVYITRFAKSLAAEASNYTDGTLLCFYTRKWSHFYLNSRAVGRLFLSVETEWVAVERKFNPGFPTIEETMYQLWYLHFGTSYMELISSALKNEARKNIINSFHTVNYVDNFTQSALTLVKTLVQANNKNRQTAAELFSVDGSLDDRFSVALEIAFHEAISSDSFAHVYGHQPAKLFAEYCNINLNKHRAAKLIDCRVLVADQDLESQALNEIQQLQVIMTPFNNKIELFIYYEMLLARRLVSNQYISLELERRALQDLKLSHILVGQADSSFRMISDKLGSDAITQKFLDYLAGNSFDPQLVKVDISVCVFGSSVWPHAMQQTPKDNMRLPEIISNLYDGFENFYRREYHMKREIMWNWRYSTATVKIYFPHARRKRAAESGYTFVLNMYQLAIMTLFIKPRGFGADNSASVDAPYLTVDMIRQATQMEIARLQSEIADFDKGLVGSAVTQALLMQNQPEDHTRPLWQVRSQGSDISGEFGSVNSVREWVRLNGWAALVIHSNATQQLETALAQNGDNAKSYNPNDAMTLFVSSGHHPIINIQIVEPATTADLGKATYAFAVSMVQEIQKGRISIPPLLAAASASSVADSNSSTSNLASIIAQPISYRQIDVAPFTFGIGPVSYLFSFLVGMLCTIGPMIGWKMSTFTFYLKVRHRDLWLAAVALIFAWTAYMGMLGALAFSAFRGPGYSGVALKYTVGRFFSLWATITITLMAVSVWLFCWFVLVPPEILGLASLVTILPNTMSTLVIAELAPHFFRWIHALPFYNGAMLYRYILSGAYPQIGANVGIILGEICVMLLALW
ncbi:hypothetical protein IWW48_005885 [Coemansia sp. RSA 1200]|nr:hypothetical protein IWW48_005885 [Coemansia sp. RSA 1200]